MRVNLLIVRKQHYVKLARQGLQLGDPTRVRSDFLELTGADRTHQIIEPFFSIGNPNVHGSAFTMPRSRARRIAPHRVNRKLRESVERRCRASQSRSATLRLYGPGY